MTNEQTLEVIHQLHIAMGTVRQLAAAGAHSQLDMRAMKVRRTGKHGAVGPLDRLDSLAVHMAAPGLQALTTAVQILNSPDTGKE